jgi:hypothetical protein
MARGATSRRRGPRARLVRLEGDRRRGATPLSDAPLTLGRDPACDIVLEPSRVSRQHARIEPGAEGYVLTDLASANGTVVNGQRVHGAVELRPGDHIELADEVTLIYEDGSVLPPVTVLAAAALVLLLGMALLFLLSSGDPVMDEATRLASQAVEASRADDFPRARERLKSAIGLLYRKGRLDDVPRRDVMSVALERLGRSMGGEVDLQELFEEALHETRPAAPPPVHAMCRLDRVGVEDFDRCLREQVADVMVGLRPDPAEIPEKFYADVARRLRYEREFFADSLERGKRYRDMLGEELERANMPPLLHYLALIESGYRAKARSPAGAVGLWQFMPGTARDYGLEVNAAVDERYDPARSTRAAARYLRNLAFEFGGDALLLALASYNRGENAVRRALKRLDDPFSDRSYWALVEARYLPRETAQYVTRFVAAAVAGLPSERVLEAAGY